VPSRRSLNRRQTKRGHGRRRANTSILSKYLPDSAVARQNVIRHANLAITSTYLRRLEGEEDSGWRKVAALLKR